MEETLSETRQRQPPVAILLVDDTPANLTALVAILEPLGYRLVYATSGEEALRWIIREDFAVILMDVQMPGLDGLQTATLIKQRDRSSHIPIIFLTAFRPDERRVFEAYSLGGVDFIEKPYDPEMLKAKVNAFVALHRLRLQTEQAARAEAAREAAEAASRAKDEFMAMLSHELRTPLNAILGWGDMLRTGRLGELPPRAAKAAETIVRNARSQSQLIEDLLDISSMVAGKMSLRKKAVDLGDLVRSAADTVRPASVEKGVELRQVLVDGCQLYCDPSRIQQVIWNLLWNAIKFTPGGGVITTTLEAGAREARLEIKDTGVGIERDFLPHVFERYQQADSPGTTRQYGGLGLGLAIVRRIVEGHGGTVLADSGGSGQGATFTVRLPVEESAE